MFCLSAPKNNLPLPPGQVYRKPVPAALQQNESAGKDHLPHYLREFYSPLELPPARQALKRWVFRL